MKAIVINRRPSSALTTPPALDIVPSSAMVLDGKPLFLPSWAPDFSAIPALGLHLCRLGRSIAPQFAPRYYDAVIPVVIVRPSLNEAATRLRGFAAAFDGAMIVGSKCPLSADGNYTLETGDLRLTLTPARLQADNTISVLSAFMTLQMGDLLVTSVPDVSLPLVMNSQIKISVNGADSALTARIK